MRTTFLILLCVIVTIPVFSQDPIIFTDVVQVENATKGDLYNRAKFWLTTAYNSPNDVIQLDSKEEGQIIGKANFEYVPSVVSGSAQIEGSINYTLNLSFKDGRYKYEITDFTHEPYGNQYGKTSMGLITKEEECPNPKPMAKGWSNKVWKDIKNQIEEYTSSLSANLIEGMNTPTQSKNDDW